MENNGFLNTLQRHRSGGVLTEASEKLAEIVQAVTATGKPGILTVRIGVSIATRGQGAVVIVDKIETKIPKEPTAGSFWFAGEDGQLTKTDTKQRELGFNAETAVAIAAAGQTQKTAEESEEESRRIAAVS